LKFLYDLSEDCADSAQSDVTTAKIQRTVRVESQITGAFSGVLSLAESNIKKDL